MLTKIISIEHLGDFRLRIKFNDGSEGVHDFSGMVAEPGPVVVPLGDPDFFARVYLKYGALTWPNGFDIDSEYLRREMEAAGELSRLEIKTNRPHERRTTQAAEGLPRRRFTVADVEAMVAAGLMDEDERIELIGGELVPMSPKGNHHEVLKSKLNIEWARRLPKGVLFTPETTFRLSEDTYLEPDFTFYEASTGLKGLNGRNALLVVEIADSSFAYDTGRKAALYASFGIRELWVIHAVRLETRIHRAPGETGYRQIEDFSTTEMLTPLMFPGLALRLADLPDE